MKLHHGAALLLCVSVRGLLAVPGPGLPPPCGPGHGVWPGDGRCHQLNTRGPCGRDQVRWGINAFKFRYQIDI